MSKAISIGTRICGTYLGKGIVGVIKKSDMAETFGHRRYQVMLDAPINVSTSRHMEVNRRSLFMTVDQDGHTVNHKGVRDDIAFIEAA